jgi:cell division transport system ATP-binding protein
MTLSDTASPYIEFKDVQVEYPGWVTGLHDVSLRIQKGDFVFFVGRTGAGKSTLIKLLTREVEQTKGSVILQGRDISHLKERDIPGLRREMGIVPQDFALLPRKRVWENVAYAMRAVGHSRSEVRRKVPEILDHVDIGHRADAFPHQLSGGEQQRVAIARALINNPPLLIADEPTGNLDPDHSWEIMELLKSLNLKGTTVLVASHDMMVIHRMERRIVTLEAGKVVDDTGKGHPNIFISTARPVELTTEEHSSFEESADAGEGKLEPEELEPSGQTSHESTASEVGSTPSVEDPPLPPDEEAGKHESTEEPHLDA